MIASLDFLLKRFPWPLHGKDGEAKATHWQQSGHPSPYTPETQLPPSIYPWWSHCPWDLQDHLLPHCFSWGTRTPWHLGCLFLHTASLSLAVAFTGFFLNVDAGSTLSYTPVLLQHVFYPYFVLSNIHVLFLFINQWWGHLWLIPTWWSNCEIQLKISSSKAFNKKMAKTRRERK